MRKTKITVNRNSAKSRAGTSTPRWSSKNLLHFQKKFLNIVQLYMILD